MEALSCRAQGVSLGHDLHLILRGTASQLSISILTVLSCHWYITEYISFPKQYPTDFKLSRSDVAILVIQLKLNCSEPA